MESEFWSDAKLRRKKALLMGHWLVVATTELGIVMGEE